MSVLYMHYLCVWGAGLQVHWLFLWSVCSISWQQMQKNLRDQKEYQAANSTSDQREIF